MQVIAYIQMDIMFISLLLLILFHANKSKYAPKKDERRLYNLHLCSIIIAIIFDAIAWFVDGKSFQGTNFVGYAANTATYLINPVPTFTWLLYVRKRLGFTTKTSRLSMFCIIVPITLNTVLALTNYYTKWYFYIDGAGYYHRSYGFASIYFFVFINALWSALLAIQATKQQDISQEERRNMRLVAIYPLTPLLGSCLQGFIYGLSAIWMGTTLAVCIYYINDTLYRLERMHRLEKEVDESRVSIMLSQIRPHFLYNALVAIQELCHTDAELAAEAVGEFGMYLRGNLDALTEQRMIPFQKELQHVSNYLSLEKKRFEERLNVTYNLTVDAFDLPVMTLQPIVENAVRHGVTKREGGGTIVISTAETRDTIRIVISDDGIGADISRVPRDGRSHVGIESVRNRLENICGGTLDITSQLGVGTTVTITIPKKRRQENV